jgi:ketosteroid isomerase-like protein
MVEDLEAIEMVRDGLAAYNDRDMEKALATLHADFELLALRSLIDGTPYRGHSGYRKFLKDMSEEWESWRLVPEEVRQIDDARIVVFARFVGHARVSGVEVDIPGAWVVTVRDGLIAEVQAYGDRPSALAEMGIKL